MISTQNSRKNLKPNFRKPVAADINDPFTPAQPDFDGLYKRKATIPTKKIPEPFEKPKVPEIKAPEIKAPKVPKFNAPKVPEFKTPELKAPSIPDLKAPSIPNVNAPNIPGVKVP